MLKDAEVQEILRDPSAHIESKDYFSWERYFTGLLIEKSRDTYLEYTKSRINPSYLSGSVKETILSRMERITFVTRSVSGKEDGAQPKSI